MSPPKTKNTGITSSGSEKARYIGSLRAAYHGASKSDNTWEILRLYDEKANGSPDLEPPPGRERLTLYEKTEAALYIMYGEPVFTSKTRTADEPLSFNPTPKSVYLFNQAVYRMVNYERNANSEGAKRLMAQFNLCLDVAGTMRDIQTTFLHHAFNEPQSVVAEVLKFVEYDFFAAWAELEVNNKYKWAIFTIEEGATHTASPIPAWLEKRATAAAARAERTANSSR
jgi:hypothetical protein